MLQRDLGNELAGTQVTASFQFEEEAFGADDRTLCQSVEKSALGRLRSPYRIGHRKELSALGRSSAPARVGRDVVRRTPALPGERSA
jgi:FKBP-type peptidyl-prolyl cis-trans isomerase 2